LPPDFDRPGGVRRIAVVPAYNEEATVAQVLDKLSYFVDELVVVDDGSTDGTRAEIAGWLPGHDHARLLSFDENQGMSAAYYLAFSDLRRRMRGGDLSSDDLVFTVDADGQHDLDVIDDLHRRTIEDALDALLVRRTSRRATDFCRRGPRCGQLTVCTTSSRATASSDWARSPTHSRTTAGTSTPRPSRSQS
jgi:glycosyltransferase involved in cell wall biosynthesis